MEKETKKIIPTLTNKEFEELLKDWGPKNMEVFEINEVFKYTTYQKSMLKRGEKNGNNNISRGNSNTNSYYRNKKSNGTNKNTRKRNSNV